MRHTKLMLLGIMLMILGISIAISIVPAIYSNSNGTSVQALRFLPGIEVFLIIIGFVIGLIGYFQKDKQS